MGRDFTIFRSLGRRPSIRTEQHDSRWLNGQCRAAGGQWGRRHPGAALLLPGGIGATSLPGSAAPCPLLPAEGDLRGACAPRRPLVPGGVPPSLCLCPAAGQGRGCALLGPRQVPQGPRGAELAEALEAAPLCPQSPSSWPFFGCRRARTPMMTRSTSSSVRRRWSGSRGWARPALPASARSAG